MPYYDNLWHKHAQENTPIICLCDILGKTENWEPAYRIWSGVWL